MKDWQKRLIAENIEDFDFDKCRDYLEVKSALRVASQKEKKKSKEKTFKNAIEKGFKQGVVVENIESGKREIVKQVSSDSHLILEGFRGGFNIHNWKIVD